MGERELGGGRKGREGQGSAGGNLAFREKLGFENLAFRGELVFENLVFRENGVDFGVGT